MTATDKNTSPILIAGPTASGKSALALALAERCGGVVINADSMQVYSELRILTSRPTATDEARVPHALYGHVPACEAYSTGRFVTDVTVALDVARARGQRPIIAGGTGLYYKALLEGLSPVPAIPDDVRQHWRDLETEHGAGALYKVLLSDDPEMAARLDTNDGQRIVRALEVVHATGKSLAEWQRTPGVPVIDPGTAVKLLVMPDRATLHARAQARFDQMMMAGALAEAEALAALKLDPALPAMRALGVAPLIRAGRGETPLEAAIGEAKAETRQYIKRQETWMKTKMITWKHVKTKEMEIILGEVIAFIQS